MFIYRTTDRTVILKYDTQSKYRIERYGVWYNYRTTTDLLTFRCNLS